jgi:hypothetical protein
VAAAAALVCVSGATRAPIFLSQTHPLSHNTTQH